MSDRTISWVPSPNFGPRPNGSGPSLVVLHGTAGATTAGDLSWCTSPQSKVSYHYLVGRTGRVYQLVKEGARAWHAGVSKWGGRSNVNDFSVGVALSNRGPFPTPEPYPEAQLEAAAWLVASILKRRGLDSSRLVGHMDVSPGRKTDPYDHFPWVDFRVRVLFLLHPEPEPNLAPAPMRDAA